MSDDPEQTPERPGNPASAPASPPPEVCDICGSTDLVEIRCKIICRNCKTILRSCSDL